jgi:Ni/Co efflux regulator RcnB
MSDATKVKDNPMRVITFTLATLIGAASITGAMADGNKHGRKDKDHRVEHSGRFCPPGLAKKHNDCTPPGHSKHRYHVGDRLHDDDGYNYVRNPDRYRLPRLGQNERYYRVGDTFVRINRDTKVVLDLITAASRVLN